MAPPVVTNTSRDPEAASSSSASVLSELQVPNREEPKSIADPKRGISASLDGYSFGAGADLRREERAAREGREEPARGDARTFSQQVAPQAEATSWFQRIGNVIGRVAEGATLLIQGSAKLVGVVAETMLSPTTWSSIGNFLTDRQTWQRAGEILSRAATGTLSALQKGVTALVTDPIGAIQTAASASWGLVKNISDSIGLTKAVSGLWQLSTAPTRALYTLATTGSLKAAGATFRDGITAGIDGLKGAGQVFCEVLGLADAYRAIKHTGLGLISLAKGDKIGAAAHFGQAAMHGAFAVMSAGAIVATVATGGAAIGSVAAVALGRTAAKEAMKQVLKQGLKTFGKELGEKALASAGKETIQKAAQEIAEKAGKESLQQLEREVTRNGGVLTREMVEVVSRQVSTKQADTVLEALKLERIVADMGEDLFRAMGRGDKTLMKNLMDAGMTKSEAKAALKEMSQIIHRKRVGVLRGRGQGKAEAQFIEELNGAFTEVVTEALYRESGHVYKQLIEKGITKNPLLREAAENSAKKEAVALSRYLDEVTEAAGKGYREGLECSVSKIGRRGLREALKRLRTRPNLAAKSKSEREEGRDLDIAKSTNQEALEDHRAVKTASQEAEMNLDALPRKFEVVVLGDGTRVVNEYVLLGHNGDEGRKLISSERFTPEQDPTLNKKRAGASKQ